MAQCTATAKGTGNRCRKAPVPGLDVCVKHGGGAKQARAAGKRRVAEQKLRNQLARLDVAPVDNPLTALSELAGQVVAWKNTIAERVNELNTIRYSTEGGEQLRAEVALFERALDRCNTVLSTIAKLNIDERLAAISEKQADAVVRAIDAALRDAGMAGDALTHAKQTAARHLRAV